jgi:hypothetical protein
MYEASNLKFVGNHDARTFRAYLHKMIKVHARLRLEGMGLSASIQGGEH